MASEHRAFPRIIWLLWLQGEEHAPVIVKQCIASWRRSNPSWQVCVLNSTTLAQHVTLDLQHPEWKKLSPNHQSDLIRLDLLSRHGGVWADASTWCHEPLDDWLPEQMDAGFFAFYRPGQDRPIATWFMASCTANPLVIDVRSRLRAHWSHGGFLRKGRVEVFLSRLLGKLLNRSFRSTRWWFSFPVRRILRLNPYYCVHYLFAQAIFENTRSRAVWESMPKIGSSKAFSLLRHGFEPAPSEALRTEIDSHVVKVYKLTWKRDTQRIEADSALGYLVASFGQNLDSPR